MNIPGHWFNAGSSSRVEATLAIDADRCEVFVNGAVVCSGQLSKLRISDRVGNIARHLYWDGVGKFETSHNDELDQALKSVCAQSGFASVLWRLESSWTVAVLALVLVAGSLYAGYKWGIPAAADRVAMSLPEQVTELVSEGAMATLDKWVFEASALDSTRQRNIRQQFTELTQHFKLSSANYRLHFRRMSIGGEPVANAMALPNGEIVVTDAFVELVDEPSELSAVLLHEMGHVEERHGLRQVLRASAISVIAAMTLGNMSGVSDIVAGLPVFLVQSSYSREHETSADTFAFKHMMRLGIDPIHFANIIKKLGGEVPDNGDNYLASHPSTANRANRAAEFSRQFNR